MNPDESSKMMSLSKNYYTVTIPNYSELVGQSLRNSRLQRRFDVDVLELQRNGKAILPPLADRKIEPEDRLLIRVTRSDLLRLEQEHTIVLAERVRKLHSNNTVEEYTGSRTASGVSNWLEQNV